MNCKLCKEEKELKNSHIIPEFFYKLLYDPLHRFNLLSSKPDMKNKLLQKGLREKLLCDNCENLLSKYEKYVSEVFFGGKPITIKTHPQGLIISDLDYVKFKIFLLSVLWRSGVSSLKFFSKVDLDSHEDLLRQMIISEKPGKSYEYGCITVMIYMNGKFVPDVILSPEFFLDESYKCFRFVIGGIMWLFYVSDHNQEYIHKDQFLSENGVLKIHKGDAEDMEFMITLAKNLHNAGKFKKRKWN